MSIREDDSDEDDDEDEKLDEGEEEIEDNYSVTDLIIAAEEIIPLLGETLSHEVFVSFFSNYQRHLLKLLVRYEKYTTFKRSRCRCIDLVCHYRKNINQMMSENQPQLQLVCVLSICPVA